LNKTFYAFVPSRSMLAILTLAARRALAMVTRLGYHPEPKTNKAAQEPPTA
jgi:hypothetical protein